MAGFLVLLLMVPAGVVALALFIGYSEEQHRLQFEQQRLAKRAERAKEHMPYYQTRVALLERVLPHLANAREILHSEMVELVGTRDELSHLLALAAAHKAGVVRGASDQRSFEHDQHKHALALRRLQNQLAAEIDRASLRPLRLEAQRTRLRVEANERVVEKILTQQAIEEAQGRTRGAPKRGRAAALRAALSEQAEQFKADGKEGAAALEAAVEALPDDADGEDS